MASIPPSWPRDYDDADFDPATDSPIPSGRASPAERQLMLANMAAPPTRLSNASQLVPIGALPPGSPASSYPPSPSLPPASPSPPLDPILTDAGPSSYRMSRSMSSKNVPFLSSPLNPTHQSSLPALTPSSSFTRPSSRQSSFARIPSEETRALVGSPTMPNDTRRSFMILYRRADVDDALLPPSFPKDAQRPNSISSDSCLSISSDSKYPMGMVSEHGLVAYAYDPSLDERLPMDEEDLLHNPDVKTVKVDGPMSWRGFKNFGMLFALVAALLCLFVVYPVYSFFHDNGRNTLIVGNIRINATGQAEFASINTRSQIPLVPFMEGIDSSTPEDVKTRRTSHGDEYTLIFSDEFETTGRNFSGDSEEFWSAVHDGLYDPRQVTTRDGHLVIRLEDVPSSDGTSSRRVSGMLQPRSLFCVAGGGYLEIRFTLPGAKSPMRAFFSGWNTRFVQDDDVPEQDLILKETITLALDFGISLSPPYMALNYPAPANVEVLVDYIRVYSRAGEHAPTCEEKSTPRFSLGSTW